MDVNAQLTSGGLGSPPAGAWGELLAVRCCLRMADFLDLAWTMPSLSGPPGRQSHDSQVLVTCPCPGASHQRASCSHDLHREGRRAWTGVHADTAHGSLSAPVHQRLASWPLASLLLLQNVRWRDEGEKRSDPLVIHPAGTLSRPATNRRDSGRPVTLLRPNGTWEKPL